MPQPYPKIRLFVDPDDVPPLQAGASLLREGDAAHYLSRVMRLKEGERVALFNGRDGAFRALLQSASKKSVLLNIEEQLTPPQPAPDVWVCFAPIKFGRIDYLVQKLTELGAAKLQPVITQYTQSERVKTERLRANAIEAAEQCERCDVPQVAEPVALRQLLADWPPDRLMLFADESGRGQPFNALEVSLPLAGGIKGGNDIFPPLQPSPVNGRGSRMMKWALLIGPEGGFSPEERSLLYEMPFVRGISLGPRILRADTAAITLLSLSMNAWGDWDVMPHFARQGAL